MFHEYDFSNICYKLSLCFQSVLYRLYMKKCKPDFNYFLGSDITFASKSIRTTPTEHTEYNRNGNVMRTWRTNQRELVWENIGTVIANYNRDSEFILYFFYSTISKNIKERFYCILLQRFTANIIHTGIKSALLALQQNERSTHVQNLILWNYIWQHCNHYQ